MRISDWSSDVCSSDLLVRLAHCPALVARRRLLDGVDVLHALDDAAPDGVLAVEEARWRQGDEELAVGRVGVLRARHAEDRKSVVSGKSVSVRVDLGGRRILTKKKTHLITDHSN